MPPSTPPGPSLWVRVILPDGALGPGKADLLAAIDAEGSISAAGRSMGMSYRRAWRLVEEMNRTCKRPLVETEVGGGSGGGARLSDLGREVLTIYSELRTELDAAGRPWLERLAELAR